MFGLNQIRSIRPKTATFALEQIGKLLLAELKSEGLGGKLYVDSLCNVLAIHLLRNYSTLELTECMERGTIEHPLSERFSLDEIAVAHEKSESRDTIGKNVVEIA